MGFRQLRRYADGNEDGGRGLARGRHDPRIAPAAARTRRRRRRTRRRAHTPPRAPTAAAPVDNPRRRAEPPSVLLPPPPPLVTPFSSRVPLRVVVVRVTVVRTASSELSRHARPRKPTQRVHFARARREKNRPRERRGGARPFRENRGRPRTVAPVVARTCAIRTGKRV